MTTSGKLERPRNFVKAYLRHQACSNVKRALTADNMHRLLAETRRSGGLSSRSVAGFLAKSAKAFIRERLEEEKVFAKIAVPLKEALTNSLIAGSVANKSTKLDEVNQTNGSCNLIGDSQALEYIVQAVLKTASSTHSRALYKSSKWLLRNICKESFFLEIITTAVREYSVPESTREANRDE